MTSLFVIRHGESQWARENRFSGWADAPLSASGKEAARIAGKTIKKAEIEFDVCMTSRLQRAQETASIVAEETGIILSTIGEDWRLNERHYGELQGHRRNQIIAEHGNAQVVQWRRSYHNRPPELKDTDKRWQEQLERLPDIPPDQQPRSESLCDAANRVIPVWEQTILPALQEGKNVLIIAHTASIRGIARIIEGMDDDQSAAFRIATAVPRRYTFSDELKTYEAIDLIDGFGARIRNSINKTKPNWFGLG